MLNKKTVTFVIPVFSSGWLLEDCLKSIRKQDYPVKKVEIILPDGGSNDHPEKIAKKYGAKIIKNQKVLAEPGYMLGAKQAKGELIVYMGADNRLVEKDWITKMVKPFEDKSIIGTYPWIRSRKENTWLTKYFNAFTDPVNHFVLGSASNPLYFHRAYSIRKKTKDYVVYNFTLQNFPMLALDQGFMLRKSYKRRKDTEYDDILPVLDMIKDNVQLAYVPSASNYHDTLDKGVFQYIKKARWGIDNNLVPSGTLGFNQRRAFLSSTRKFLMYFWPFYAISIIGPIIYSLIGILRDGKREWMYHTPMTLLTAGLVIYEVIRIKVFGQPSLASRQ